MPWAYKLFESIVLRVMWALVFCFEIISFVLIVCVCIFILNKEKTKRIRCLYFSRHLHTESCRARSVEQYKFVEGQSKWREISFHLREEENRRRERERTENAPKKHRHYELFFPVQNMPTHISKTREDRMLLLTISENTQYAYDTHEFSKRRTKTKRNENRKKKIGDRLNAWYGLKHQQEYWIYTYKYTQYTHMIQNENKVHRVDVISWAFLFYQMFIRPSGPIWFSLNSRTNKKNRFN